MPRGALDEVVDRRNHHQAAGVGLELEAHVGVVGPRHHLGVGVTVDAPALLDQAHEGLVRVELAVGLPDVLFGEAVGDEDLGGHEDAADALAGHRGHVHLGGAGQVVDHLGGVAVAGGLVDPQGPAALGVMAGGAGFGSGGRGTDHHRHEDGVPRHQTLGVERVEAQKRGRGGATGAREPVGVLDGLGVDLGVGVGELLQQLGARVGAVEALVELQRLQPEVGREVDDVGRFFLVVVEVLRRHPVGQPQHDQVGLLQLFGVGELEVRLPPQVGVHEADGLTQVAAARHLHDVQVGVAQRQAQKLAPGVARASNDDGSQGFHAGYMVTARRAWKTTRPGGRSPRGKSLQWL